MSGPNHGGKMATQWTLTQFWIYSPIRNFSLLVSVLIFGVQKGLTIQCFVCDAVHFNFECNGTENIRQCPITYDTCLTMIHYSSTVGKLQISKRCSKKASCITQSQTLENHAPCDSNQTEEWACTHCCDTHDLCNANSGSQTGRLSSAADGALIMSAFLAPFISACITFRIYRIEQGILWIIGSISISLITLLPLSEADSAVLNNEQLSLNMLPET